MQKTLLKSINLDLDKSFPNLSPFLNSVFLNEDKVTLLFLLKVNTVNSQTLKIETFEIPTEDLDKLNQLPIYLESKFVGEFYEISFSSTKINLIKQLNNFYDTLTDTFKKPFNHSEIEEDKILIETVKGQIEASKKQAEVWQEDLEEVKILTLKKKKDRNKEFEDLINQAIKENLI